MPKIHAHILLFMNIQEAWKRVQRLELELENGRTCNTSNPSSTVISLYVSKTRRIPQHHSTEDGTLDKRMQSQRMLRLCEAKYYTQNLQRTTTK